MSWLGDQVNENMKNKMEFTNEISPGPAHVLAKCVITVGRKTRKDPNFSIAN